MCRPQAVDAGAHRKDRYHRLIWAQALSNTPRRFFCTVVLYSMFAVLKFVFVAVTLAIALAQQPADPIAIGKNAFNLLLDEKYLELRSMFNQQMLDRVSEDMLRNQLGSQLKGLGKPEKIGEARIQKINNHDVVVIPAKLPGGSFDFLFTIDDAGKIAGLFLRPSSAFAAEWTRPSYSKPDSFHERDVTVGDGEWKLPGTLTVPIGKGPFPAVVLVHGSGPHDRDETISANKPFRDLAEGLASRGIAVLRYEKRTFVYPARMAAVKDLTVQQETVEDAVKAAALLRQQPEIDPNRIYVLGHSLGGYLAPRIAPQDGKLAGLIILAGSARPIEDIILEQNEHFGATPEQLEAVKRQIAKIKNLQPGDTSTEKIFNMPVSYLLDLKNYNAPAEAKTLSCRMLIMQGERDFQVSMADFKLWQSALAGRKDVTFRAYPTLNHLFIAGEGNGSLQEYDKPGHVAEQVIDDIASWILAGPPIARSSQNR